jgi:hypothetical protein
VIAEVIERHGLFCELYTDRGSHYFHTPKAGEPVSRTVRTQVGRALAQLGIRHIAAYSPEARGRSERAYRTLQDRRVGNDNTVKWRRLSLQIPPSPQRPHFVRAAVRVHEYPDGHLAIFHGPHRLADYDPRGNLRDDAKLAA